MQEAQNAACVLVERPARSSRVVLELAGLGFGHERAAILTEEPPLQGLGLTAAVRDLTDIVPALLEYYSA